MCVHSSIPTHERNETKGAYSVYLSLCVNTNHAIHENRCSIDTEPAASALRITYSTEYHHVLCWLRLHRTPKIPPQAWILYFFAISAERFKEWSLSCTACYSPADLGDLWKPPPTTSPSPTHPHFYLSYASYHDSQHRRTAPDRRTAST